MAIAKTFGPNPAKLEPEVCMALTQEDVISALKECYDPEIPVNIVDLGLIYEVRLKPTEVPNLQGEDVEVEMTLTAPGCPSHQEISQQVQQRLLRMPGVGNATVNIVWYPQWTPERLSPEARKQLGIE
jgi:metal-sulfur cluster biosynthetic enzyme